MHQLSKEEYDIIVNLIGNNCKSLAVCLAEMHLTKPPYHTHWNIECKVIVCLVKDNTKNTYFLKVFEYERLGVILEQESHCILDYECQTANFHKFKVNDCTVGLNFFNTDDANNFRDKFNKTLLLKDPQRILNKCGSRSSYAEAKEKPLIVSNLKRSLSLLSINKKQLKPSDISAPTNFTHIQHNSYGNELNLLSDDPKLKVFLTLAEISKDQWETENFPRYFIYEIIDKYGGIDAAIESYQKPPSMPTITSKNVKFPLKCSNNSPVSTKKPLPPVPPRRTVSFSHNHNDLTKCEPQVSKPLLPPRAQSSQMTAPPVPPRRLPVSPLPKLRSSVGSDSVNDGTSELHTTDKPPKYINCMNNITEEK